MAQTGAQAIKKLKSIAQLIHNCKLREARAYMREEHLKKMYLAELAAFPKAERALYEEKINSIASSI